MRIKVLFYVLFLAVWVSNCTSTNINQVRIIYSTEEFNTITPVRCGDLSLIDQTLIDTVIINEIVFLKKLEKELSNLRPINDSLRQIFPRLDTRVELEIQYRNGGLNDNVCLDRAGDIVVNDTVMYESKSLINTIFQKTKDVTLKVNN